MSEGFDCTRCARRSVCPAYMATQTSCGDYVPDWCCTRDTIEQMQEDTEKPAP